MINYQLTTKREHSCFDFYKFKWGAATQPPPNYMKSIKVPMNKDNTKNQKMHWLLCN